MFENLKKKKKANAIISDLESLICENRYDINVYHTLNEITIYKESKSESKKNRMSIPYIMSKSIFDLLKSDKELTAFRLLTFIQRFSNLNEFKADDTVDTHHRIYDVLRHLSMTLYGDDHSYYSKHECILNGYSSYILESMSQVRIIDELIDIIKSDNDIINDHHMIKITDDILPAMNEVFDIIESNEVPFDTDDDLYSFYSKEKNKDCVKKLSSMMNSLNRSLLEESRGVIRNFQTSYTKQVQNCREYDEEKIDKVGNLIEKIVQDED